MSVVRIIFEKGIEIGNAQNSIRLPVNGRPLVDLYAQVMKIYGVRPLLVTENVGGLAGSPHERHLVLALDGQSILNVRLSSISLPKGLAESRYSKLLRPAMNIQYAAGAMVYHCEQLALLYASICDQACDYDKISGIECKAFDFQGQSAAYYEIDAMITSARRTYDSIRYILWPVFGLGGGQTPRNFIKTLDACNRMPARLREVLAQSWSLYGEKLTAYRDCIQHYVPISHGFQTACLEQVVGGYWSVCLRIPDNPEAKSQHSFCFPRGLDALTYCWEVANELIDVAVRVLDAIPVETNESISE